MKEKIDITKHILIPTHIKLTEQEKQELFKKYNISFRELPYILNSDQAIKELKVKEGDVVKIIRKSPTAGEAIFYRGVIDG